MSRRFKNLVIILFALLGLITLADIIEDWQENVPVLHLVTEALLFSLAMFALYMTVKYIRVQHDNLVIDNEKLRDDLDRWQAETALLRRRLREDIQAQFKRWGFTKAETEVAFLVLRGFNFATVASLLGKSEKTCRLQAQSIYEKSGLGSRSSFAGFFLESLFVLEDEESFYD